MKHLFFITLLFLMGCTLFSTGGDKITKKDVEEAVVNGVKKVLKETRIEMTGESKSVTNTDGTATPTDKSKIKLTGKFITPEIKITSDGAEIPHGYYTDTEFAKDFGWLVAIIIIITIAFTRITSSIPVAIIKFIPKRLMSLVISGIASFATYLLFEVFTHHVWWMLLIWSVVGWGFAILIWDNIFKLDYLKFFTNQNPKDRFPDLFKP